MADAASANSHPGGKDTDSDEDTKKTGCCKPPFRRLRRSLPKSAAFIHSKLPKGLSTPETTPSVVLSPQDSAAERTPAVLQTEDSDLQELRLLEQRLAEEDAQLARQAREEQERETHARETQETEKMEEEEQEEARWEKAEQARQEMDEQARAEKREKEEQEEARREEAEKREQEEQEKARREKVEKQEKEEQEKARREKVEKQEKEEQEKAMREKAEKQQKARRQKAEKDKVRQEKETHPLAEDLMLQRINLESWKMQDHELLLADVLPAKAAAITAIARAIDARDFERAKQLKHLREILAKDQSAMWARLANCKTVHRQLASRVNEAVDSENFEVAKALHEVQALAEECIRGFAIREGQGGCLDLGNGCVCLGTAASLGMLQGNFTVEFWLLLDLAADVVVLKPARSEFGSFPNLSIRGGRLEAEFCRGQRHVSQVPFPEKQCWTHVAFSWSQSKRERHFEVCLFQDGSQVAFGTESMTLEVDSELQLGSFCGKVAELRIWDHARSRDMVEQCMERRCTGNEDGLSCCLSFLPTRGLSDSTLDPAGTLEQGHIFADRCTVDGSVTWDGDFPPLLKVDGQDDENDAVEAEETLARAWKWLEGRHEGQALQCKVEAEQRKAEAQQRQEDLQQRRKYAKWMEEQAQEAELERHKSEEEEQRRQRARQELERSRSRKLRPWSTLVRWTCPMASLGKEGY
eukprot:TRINITY_DN5300_c0_g1_i2.p1 TRINITY_DN5300_c0_g1~~TRINITY_DN5300_c0_g1_i2.p1  ORF type:complete len:704 (+),score=243.41 TRINITY_DN5300_c0_g1_i2:23-2113(+)